MDKIKISVIVPVFNVENYIDKCIDSILNQTYSNFELILINDGSTDSSYAHLLRYKSDKRVSIIDKPNTGQSDSRYQGLLKSTGDYIFFMDSDDTIEKESLEYLAHNVITNKSDVVFGRYRLVDEDGKELRCQAKYNVCGLYENKEIIKDSLGVKNFKASLWIKLIKRSLLLECYSESVRTIRVNEDILLSFLLSTKCNNVTFRNDIIYNVLQRKESLSRAIKPELITSSDVIYAEIKNVLERMSLFNELKAEYYGGYTKTILYALAVAAKHTPLYRSFDSMYHLIDKSSIYFSDDLKSNIRLVPIKYQVLYKVGKKPRLFYFIIRLINNALQY